MRQYLLPETLGLISRKEGTAGLGTAERPACLHWRHVSSAGGENQMRPEPVFSLGHYIQPVPSRRYDIGTTRWRRAQLIDSKFSRAAGINRVASESCLRVT